MKRKYRLGDGLLTTTDLEAMNKEDFTTIGTFVQEFKKRSRKVHGISEEAQCAIFLGLLTASEAVELTRHGECSTKLTWTTIDRGVEVGCLDQVEQRQVRLQRQKRKERDATASGTPGVRRIVTDVLAQLGYAIEPVVQRRVVTDVKVKGKEPVIEEAVQEELWEEAEPVLQHLTKVQRKVQKVIDRLLEGHNDLMILKEILASAPRLLDELKGRLSRRLVPNVHLGTILPKEAEWAESGTKMDCKCVACGTVDLVVKGSKCAAMVDTGAEMNIIREVDATRFGLDIDRSDCGILHGASCKAVFCGIASNVLIEVGKVKARACFFIMPDVDHGILLGRSFLSRTKTVMFNKHDGTLILLLCDPACENYEIITCRNTGSRSIRNRPNPGSFTIEESEGERRRLRAEPEAGERVKAFSLILSDVGKTMDLVAAHEMEDPDAIQALREQVLECPEAGKLELVYRLPGSGRNPASVQAQSESLDQSGSLNPAGNVDEVPESQDDEFEEREIKEAFRAEEYDGIYLELGLLLSCEMRLRDASDRAQRMLQRYLVRDGHLFVRREVGNPRRVVCSRNHQIDVVVALHDGIAGGHRGVQATYAKISDLYYWNGMMDMVEKFCRSCVPCQERSRLRQGEPLHPRLEREVGAVVHLDLLFMPLGDQGYNYIFDARDNLSGFVDGRAIRTKTGSVLVSCIEEYYLRYPFVREFVMDRGSEFTCQEVQELLSRSDFTKTAMPRGGKGTWPPRRLLGTSGGYERHGPHHRESTPVYDDGNIELFLDNFWDHARRMGWIVAQAIERLRGAGRFEEPVARIRREATTRSEVEWRMQELRPSHDEEHGEQAEEVPREEVPREEVLQEEFQDTQRKRGLGNEERRAGKEVIEVGEDTPPQTPAVGLRPEDAPRSMRQTGGELQREEAPLPSSEKTPSREGRAERRRERAAVRREALTLIDRHLAAHALEHPDLEEPTPTEPRQERCQPEKEVEAEIPKRVDLRTRERAPAGETDEEKRARRTRRIEEIWQERQRLEAAGELPEQQEERQRSEAAGGLPGQPPSAPARAPEIPEMWRDFWEQRGEELPSPVRAGLGVARKAKERLDRKIKFLMKAIFDRHLLLESDLAGKKIKEAGDGVRLKAMDVEIQELRVLVASQAAIIESLRQRSHGEVDEPERSQQGEQRRPGHGLSGQPSTVETRQEPPIGRVILEPEEARA
ncbi:hypothetical protein CBR_g31647 [Chara braunii]|uniref:Integrase zinc-binding domain-containing protein n=1 Tax=Chara braunii TaxID=69332 RepID=A0A388LFJ1_CHABU|nr:hypothetical protein CBR_g31647 [Chara braunii]|eukprot:GBG81090.1 hypothetical protein CBR_g31647 [Chara braunii]